MPRFSDNQWSNGNTPDYPDVGDVRLATAYDYGNLTGTLVVSGGGGDATLAKQDEMLALLAAIQATVDSIEGSGLDIVRITVEDDLVPEPGVLVWVTLDAEGTQKEAGPKSTNAAGQVEFLLTDGSTYYLFAYKTGKISIIGEEFVAEAVA